MCKHSLLELRAAALRSLLPQKDFGSGEGQACGPRELQRQKLNPEVEHEGQQPPFPLWHLPAAGSVTGAGFLHLTC